MRNETTNTAGPKMRFPEFEEAGDWPFLNGNKLFDQISNKNHNSDLPILAITQEHGAIPRHLIDYNVVVTEKSVESYKVIEPGDFIISLRSFQGGIEYSTYTGICSPAYIILRRRNSGTDAFFKQYFKTPAFIGNLNKNIEGLRDGKMVSYKQFSELYLPTPSLEEQQKIAAALSSLDDLFTAHSAKLAALQAHKRGLMQGLFPAEGETVPKLRFPAFREAVEWEEKTLGEVLEFIMGNAFRSDEFTENGVQLIRMGNLYQGELQLSRAPVFLPKAFKNKYSNFLVNPSDLLMSMTGTLGKRDYGFIVQVPEGCSDLFLNQRVLKIIPKESCIKEFVLQQMKQEVFLDKLYFMPGGTKQVNLSVKHLCEIRIPFPQILEQQKIADCLSSLDNRINAQTHKIEALKLHKKGLMQGLFPAAAEPTA